MFHTGLLKKVLFNLRIRNKGREKDGYSFLINIGADGWEKRSAN